MKRFLFALFIQTFFAMNTVAASGTAVGVTDTYFMNIALCLTGGIVLLLVLLLIYVVRNSQKTEIQNTDMATKIQELLTYKRAYYKVKKELHILKEKELKALKEKEMKEKELKEKEQIEKALKEKEMNDREQKKTSPEITLCDANVNPPAKVKVKNSASNANKNENQLLFEKLDFLITSRKMFVDSNLSRSDLMKLINVDKNRLGKILHQHANMNAQVYINKKRIEYAAELLRTNPTISMLRVAQKCGLPNVSTFCRLFKEKYGVTTTEYKNGLHLSDCKQDMPACAD